MVFFSQKTSQALFRFVTSTTMALSGGLAAAAQYDRQTIGVTLVSATRTGSESLGVKAQPTRSYELPTRYVYTTGGLTRRNVICLYCSCYRR